MNSPVGPHLYVSAFFFLRKYYNRVGVSFTGCVVNGTETAAARLEYCVPVSYLFISRCSFFFIIFFYIFIGVPLL